ncbi:MAG: prolipoprotein diacylglyceryl transferase [Oscillospiraceae bacterium]|nr:prolipoprotein diacylglyceryl transferase [Oscillospiraceae bacterium]
MIEFPNLFSGISIDISRRAFSLFGLEVYWYGIIITAAVVLGIAYGVKLADRAGILSDDVFEIAFWGVLCGVIGARTYYVIFSPSKMSLATAIFGIRDGGLAVYGGLIGAVLGGFIAARIKRVKFLPLSDLIGLGFLIGHCVGRWGNFFNQEAYGAATAGNLPWGMTGDKIMSDLALIGVDPFALVHPCFLYESIWCLLGFISLHLYAKKLRSFDGEVFLLYLVWYGSGRAWIESLRADSLMAGGVRVSQVLAVLSAVFALGLFLYLKTTLPKKNYVMYKDTEESRQLINENKTRIKLEKEKEKAKDSLRKTKRELTDPFDDTVDN